MKDVVYEGVTGEEFSRWGWLVDLRVGGVGFLVVFPVGG
jgi:hypothetical protein